MAANIQDVIMLFGDSITQGGWEPDLNGFGQRLSREYLILIAYFGQCQAQMSTQESSMY
jgi:hypothetical protein